MNGLMNATNHISVSDILAFFHKVWLPSGGPPPRPPPGPPPWGRGLQVPQLPPPPGPPLLSRQRCLSPHRTHSHVGRVALHVAVQASLFELLLAADECELVVLLEFVIELHTVRRGAVGDERSDLAEILEVCDWWVQVG